MGDTMALVMQANGDDPTKVTDATFNRAMKRIQKAVDSGQVRQFTGNDYSGPLAKGDLKACMAWSGDVVQLQSSNKHLHWNVPKDGGGIWTDNMLIPKGGDVYTASVYMNYVYAPKIAAEIEDYVNYVCPVVGAKQALEKIDPGVAKNTLIFPTKQMLDNAHVIDPTALNNEKWQTTWQNLISA
jgi:spermidine/putrescine transport system substrate-binding protein